MRLPLIRESVIPSLIAWPVRILPGGIHQGIAVEVLNRVFGQALAQGELDFMEHRIVTLALLDPPFRLHLTASRRRLRRPSVPRKPDLLIEAEFAVYTQLLTREADPDTLFFQRRLRIRGDTELGLNVKNFLAAWEPDAGQQWLLELAQRGRQFTRRLG